MIPTSRSFMLSALLFIYTFPQVDCDITAFDKCSQFRFDCGDFDTFRIRLRGGSSEQIDSWEIQKPRATRKTSDKRKAKAAEDKVFKANQEKAAATTFLGWVYNIKRRVPNLHKY
jgi:hypothetical protein